MKDATDLELFRHTLTALKDIARFLEHMFYMRVSDVDAAFPLLPIAPRLWRYMMFIWFDVQPGGEASMLTWLYMHVCGDFGSAGLPGTWKIFFTDVVMGMARSEMVLTLAAPIYVDDISLIGELQRMVDSEGAALAAFLRMLGIYIKEIKDRAAAQVQLALGFWWDSVNRTRTLSERKQQEYVAMLREFETRRTLTLRERQQVAGRMQRAVMTMPPGAACFMASMYSLMRGLSLPHGSRGAPRVPSGWTSGACVSCCSATLAAVSSPSTSLARRRWWTPTRQRAGHTLGVVMLHAAGATDSFATRRSRAAPYDRLLGGRRRRGGCA